VIENECLEWRRAGYSVSTDKRRLQVDRIHGFLSAHAYWCLSVPRSVVSAAMEMSLCFGVYEDSLGYQIGYARVITDGATFAWICDVYVEEQYRGQGLATWLIECLLTHPRLKNLRRICLATKDACRFYEKFGFTITKTPSSWMEIKDNDIYKSSGSELQK
jgi:GNAT superfamily N-acetyltransferase